MSRWYCRSVFRSPDGCRFPCADRAAGKSQDRLAGGRSMDPCLCARPACRSQRIGAVVHADDQRLVAGEDGKVGSLFREPGQFFQMRLHDIGKRRRRVDAERDAHQTCPRDVFRAANVTGNAGFSQRCMTRSAVPRVRRVALVISVTETGSTAEARCSNASKAPATVGLKYCILAGSASVVFIY